ncbi:MAG: Radical domain heme biosynthesis protein, partial [bacterium]|nr:Radical domain heme biosynthesis protein [bacterium]
MRSELVFTNYRCNQNCVHCTFRKAQDDLALIQGAAVRARIDAAIGRGATEIVLTGGEPTLRGDLPALVAHARQRGAAVCLETNAIELDDTAARALADAGLTRAAVNLSGWDDALDGVTRDPGGFARTRKGLSALAAAGIPVEIHAVVVRSTLPLLAALPSGLATLFPPAAASRSLLRGIVIAAPVTSPDERELVSYDEASSAILALEAAARRHAISLRMRPGSGPPPCMHPPRTRTQHLYAMTPGAAIRADHVKLAACASCLVDDRCSGLPAAYLARHPEPSLHPIAEERVRRRLSVISSIEEQMAREFVTPNRLVDPVHGVLEEDIVRVQFHCNQSCTFCFVSTHLPPVSDGAIREAIVSGARAGRKITLSGGEPTLNPLLTEYVALAKAHSRLPVGLQTNAVRLDDERLVAGLVAAGLDQAFVSLHGSTAEICDAVTEAPGTFVRTVAGLDHLARTSVELIINFVIRDLNYADLPSVVRLIGARWPKALANISFVALSSDVVPRDRRLVPRYADVLPYVADAIGEARRLGVRV